MNDFQAALAPRSDQINASDLLAGDMTVTIAAVKVTPGTEQPVSIRLEGMDKVWRPCKTTGRILMAAWGPDTSIYPGRSAQLYLDPEVKWGGMKVGGIRIRALSHIDAELQLALAESKQNRKIFRVKPLAGAPRRADPPRQSSGGSSSGIDGLAKAQAAKGSDAFRDWLKTDTAKAAYADGSLTAAVLADCRIIASGADKMRAMPDPLAEADLPPVPTDPEIEARLAAEHAAFLADQEREAG